MKSKKNILVIGIGGVGGYFGGKIAWNIEKSKNTDYQVNFIARGEHLKAIQEKGLILNKADNETITCRPHLAIDNIYDIQQFDIIILAIKSYDLEPVMDQISSRINKNTIILPLLNGVDIYERIRQKITSGLVLPSCVYISSHIEKPGVITHRIGKELVIMGPDPQHKDIYPSVLLEAFSLFDINYKWTEEVETSIWEKYIFIAPYALVTALYDKTIGEVFSNNNLKETTRKIMLEIYQIGKKRGIAFSDNIVENALNLAGVLPHNTKTSYQLDIAKKGTRNESNIYAETIIEMSKNTGTDIPVTLQTYNNILTKLKSKNSV
jgi:2-dehydropantoate 2-reductase